MDDAATSVSPSTAHPVTVDRVIDRVRAYAVHCGWTKSRLAAEAGIRDTTLKHFYRRDWSPTARTLRRLEAIIPESFTFRGPGEV